MAVDDDQRDALLVGLESLFLQIGRMAGSYHHGAGAESGFTPTQFMMLTWLARQNAPTPMRELADAMGISMAGATGVVDRLVHAGLVARERSDQDRRLVLVQLTALGRDRIEGARHQGFLRFRRLTDSISVQDLEALTRILAVILDKVRQDAERGHTAGD